MLAALVDLIVPPRCAGCGEPGPVACPACTAELLRDPAPRPPDPPPPDLPECWSATGYDGAARRMILACKERGRTAVAPVLGACLAEVAVAALDGWAGPVALVPIPSARAASRRRGHDPVSVIAAAAAAELCGRGRPATVAPVLRQARRVADQAGLSSTQRAANLSGAFEVKRHHAGLLWPYQGRAVATTAAVPATVPPGYTGAALPAVPVVVVLVDDIVTTGTTLAEAARVIRAAGAEVRLAITVAATRRRARTQPPTRRR